MACMCGHTRAAHLESWGACQVEDCDCPEFEHDYAGPQPDEDSYPERER